MPTAALAVFAALWPFVAGWIVLKFLPNALTTFVTKEIDRRSDAKLERVKADLQGAYATLKTSVDVLSATNSGMHPHIVEAVSALWQNMLAMRDKYGTMIGFDTLLLAEEAQRVFADGGPDNLLEYVRPFEGELHTNPLMVEFNNGGLDRHRLFTGDRLWLIFYIYRAVLLRNGFLISRSFERREYHDWRLDNGVRQLLESALDKEIVTTLTALVAGGLSAAIARLEGEFLHEATRVMSGSKAIADSLSDMHAIILLQNAKVGDRSYPP